MLVVIFVTALAVLALVTQAGVFLAQRAHPAQGRMVEVAGGTLHILDIGPRDVAGPPIVMLHGASANLEVMLPFITLRRQGLHKADGRLDRLAAE